MAGQQSHHPEQEPDRGARGWLPYDHTNPPLTREQLQALHNQQVILNLRRLAGVGRLICTELNEAEEEVPRPGHVLIDADILGVVEEKDEDGNPITSAHLRIVRRVWFPFGPKDIDPEATALSAMAQHPVYGLIDQLQEFKEQVSEDPWLQTEIDLPVPGDPILLPVTLIHQPVFTPYGRKPL